MVQMKVITLTYPANFSLDFISHMVQMKDNKNLGDLRHLLRLYIPHGSDERNIRRRNSNIINKLYIPHGSDESWIEFDRSVEKEKLYIPHGSDESIAFYHHN